MHAKTLQERVLVYFSLVDVLGTNEKFKEAMELSVQVLKELGEPIPKKAHIGHVIVCLMRIKGLMKGKTDDDLLSVSSLLLCDWNLSHPKVALLV